MRPHLSAVLSALVLAAALPVCAQSFIFPTGYSYSTPPEGQAQGGAFDYFDDTHNPPGQPLGQLTDGIKGGNDWAADLGNGNGQEWVAWSQGNPTITFDFASTVSLQSVTIGFNRGTGGVALPDSVTIGGTVFTLIGTELADNTRGDLTFSGSWTGNSLDVTLADADTSFIFVDEVQFLTAAVPEPQWTLAAVGAALAGFAAWRRRRR